MRLSDLLHWEPLVEKVLQTFAAFKGAQVGDVVQIPEVKADVGSQEWQIDAHTARRLK